jgi:hypothetical protein
MHATTLRSLQLMVGLLVGASWAGAAPIPSEPGETPPSRPDAWRKALTQKYDLTFQNASLSQVAETLKDLTKVPIHLDSLLMNFGVNILEPSVNVELKQVRLDEGLRRILAPYNLHFAVTREGIFISSEEMVIARQLRQRVRVDCTETRLMEAIQQLMHETGANVVIDPRLQDKAAQKVTLRLEDVPLESAVRLLAELADLRTIRMNNVLFITTPERAERLRADADPPVPCSAPASAALPAMPGAIGGFGVFGGFGGAAVPGFPGIPGAEPAVRPREPDKASGADLKPPQNNKSKDATPAPTRPKDADR